MKFSTFKTALRIQVIPGNFANNQRFVNYALCVQVRVYMVHVYCRANQSADMCNGDMMFYWFKQVNKGSETYIHIGTGPNYNDSSLTEIPVAQSITKIKMYGLMTEATFLFGMC